MQKSIRTNEVLLTQADIVELTHRKHRKAQSKALAQMGIEHKTRPDGSLVVLKSHVEKILDGSDTAMIEKDFEPNWSALDDAAA